MAPAVCAALHSVIGARGSGGARRPQPARASLGRWSHGTRGPLQPRGVGRLEGLPANASGNQALNTTAVAEDLRIVEDLKVGEAVAYACGPVTCVERFLGSDVRIQAKLAHIRPFFLRVDQFLVSDVGSDIGFQGSFNFEEAKYIFTLRDEESEGDVDVVEGSIPAEFPRGAYLRNGPNARFRDRSDHFFDGDGMVHGTVFAEDGSVSYFARWVRSTAFDTESAKGRTFGGVLNDDGFLVLRNILCNMVLTGQQFKDTANTSVVYHQGHLLALMEAQLPAKVEIGAKEMRTVDPAFDYGGTLKHRFTAHPKVDPISGDLYTMGYQAAAPPYLEYSVIQGGRVRYTTPVDVGRACMMHDWAITENYLVFMDLPIVFKTLERLVQGRAPFGYYPEDGARFGIARKGSSEVTWFPVAPCNVFHTANAYEDPHTGEVVVHGVRASASRSPFYEVFNPSFLHEWRLDPATGAVTERRVCDRVVEFPRVNERFLGRPGRFCYVAEASQVSSDAPKLHGFDSPREAALFDSVLKVCLQTGEVAAQYVAPSGTSMGEMAFVAREGGSGEDDGWLCGYMCCGRTRRSFLVMLDAHDLSLAAKLQLPGRVPYGLHGTFVPLEAVTLP